MTIKIAIIGSGPSAFYTVQNLVKSDLDCEIDILEKLFSPYGLVRYGIAPDHQSTKNIIRVFEKVLLNKKVQFFGNVEINNDPSLNQLMNLYDAVVISTGMAKDKPLNINELNKEGYYGATEFVNWYNGHPAYVSLNPDLKSDTAIVIGNGNVAIDCARLLVKSKNELKNSDITSYAYKALINSSIKKVYIVGRRGPLDAKFTTVEIREMGELNDCSALLSTGTINSINKNQLNDDLSKQYRILTNFPEANNINTEKNKSVEFKFYASPIEIIGDKKVTGIKFKNNLLKNNNNNEYFTINCGIVISAIGYTGYKISNIKTNNNGMILHKENIIKKGLYTTGWISRGPNGVVGTNKHDGAKVAKHIIENIKDQNKEGRKGIKKLLNNLSIRYISKEEWIMINEEEIKRSDKNFSRSKFTSNEEVYKFLNKKIKSS